MHALAVFTQLVLALAACGCIGISIKVLKLMPTRWLKIGLLMILWGSIILSNTRIVAYMFGIHMPVVVLLTLLDVVGIGCIIVSLAVFGLINGHYHPPESKP